MHLEQSIEIAAPTSTVWEIITDVARWPEWTPTFKAIEVLDGGSFATGMRARITQPAIPKATWTVTEVRPGEGFVWTTKNLGMSMRADHQIVPTPAGCRVTLVLDLTGFAARLLAPVMAPALRKALRQESAGLKRRAEGAS